MSKTVAHPEIENMNSETVRNNFAFGLSAAPLMEVQGKDIDWPEYGKRDQYKILFDEWLAEVERVASEKSYDQALEDLTGEGFLNADELEMFTVFHNPYREKRASSV